MNQQNNQNNRYTNPPNFGTNYPNTQYKGYTEQEGSPYGSTSNMNQPQNQSNQYGYTTQYQGDNPYHSESRYSNLKTHGGTGYTSQSSTSPYQGMSQQYSNTTTMTPVQQQRTQTGTQYTDRDRINDLLLSEKYLTEGYNISTFEATNSQLQSTIKNILNNTHTNREILHQTMQQRGWYQTEPADQQQVSQTYSEFNSYKSQLPY
ncbi:MAG: spore coat protein [Halanaerobiales bacterium]|nr:spore coat protein [Halanaerobiales bacterium]